NVTVRGVVYASGGSFTGEIQATSGKFTGTVEATSFVGDVANMYTGSDVSRLNDGVLEKTITYNDTSSAAHRRHICVMANVKGFGGCTINIDGSEKNLPMDGNERLVMHSSPVTSRAVTVKIKVSAQNSMGAYINSPTVIVTRGSGSFSG
ncbi:TPA: host specificity protein, partial [Escherichia coli]|nr:host specificity protein [Escherichia coli]